MESTDQRVVQRDDMIYMPLQVLGFLVDAGDSLSVSP